MSSQMDIVETKCNIHRQSCGHSWYTAMLLLVLCMAVVQQPCDGRLQSRRMLRQDDDSQDTKCLMAIDYRAESRASNTLSFVAYLDLRNQALGVRFFPDEQ